MELNKPYVVFAFNPHVEYGGWNDMKGMFETLHEARAFVKSIVAGKYLDGYPDKYNYAQIVDMSVGEIMLDYEAVL